MEWQPIETVPRDRSNVIVAQFFEGEWWIAVAWFDQWDGSWVESNIGFDCEPSHWMPLPKPPEVK